MTEPFNPPITVETCERPGCTRKFERSDGLTGGYCSDACLQIDNRYLHELPPVMVIQRNKYEGINPYRGRPKPPGVVG
ncbi:MAG TPA: hypothetical protein VGW74_21050 [Propionibacteriaceae bacterium]|nr:hypothetical protein [Propionibacteriaceae bacterium]